MRASCLAVFLATAPQDKFIRASCQSKPSHDLMILHCLWSDLPQEDPIVPGLCIPFPLKSAQQLFDLGKALIPLRVTKLVMHTHIQITVQPRFRFGDVTDSLKLAAGVLWVQAPAPGHSHLIPCKLETRILLQLSLGLGVRLGSLSLSSVVYYCCRCHYA